MGRAGNIRPSRPRRRTAPRGGREHPSTGGSVVNAPAVGPHLIGLEVTRLDLDRGQLVGRRDLIIIPNCGMIQDRGNRVLRRVLRHCKIDHDRGRAAFCGRLHPHKPSLLRQFCCHRLTMRVGTPTATGYPLRTEALLNILRTVFAAPTFSSRDQSSARFRTWRIRRARQNGPALILALTAGQAYIPIGTTIPAAARSPCTRARKMPSEPRRIWRAPNRKSGANAKSVFGDRNKARRCELEIPRWLPHGSTRMLESPAHVATWVGLSFFRLGLRRSRWENRPAAKR